MEFWCADFSMCLSEDTVSVYTFWWGMTGMGESILGVAVGTGAGRLDLSIRQKNMPLK